MKKVVADSTGYWRDKYDTEHAEKYMLEGDLQELKTVYGEMIAQKANELKIKEKDIKSLVGFNTRQKVSLDSLVKKYATYDTSIVKGENGKPDVVYITQEIPKDRFIDVTDSLGVTQYEKHTGFLKLKRDPYIDIVSYSGSKVSGIQGYRLRDLDPTFKVRPAAGIVYADKWMPSVGVGVEFKVAKIPVVLTIQKAFP